MIPRWGNWDGTVWRTWRCGGRESDGEGTRGRMREAGRPVREGIYAHTYMGQGGGACRIHMQVKEGQTGT